ncbi:DUF3443 domain-containing protein [Paraburkholderia sp. CNPSo 3272]|uniref:DUF3443 domain-containing protein n=1 Tax=Paraburkholderia sp. CNPSo 3272 TaxID=2940931 RepID=UPI0020B72668|nr:DUF3443 domain-containing protein [Paraburkholderia sp. CNPSo 3272]MCP3726008.1 DUF3443 domain-containing protein [Paraburkholderia sp. CNPSo 3272]
MKARPRPLASLALLALFSLGAALAACGGDGAGTASAGTSATAPTSAPSPSSAPSTAGTSGTVPQSTTPNVVAVTVGPSPTSTRNMLMASVTVCVPGTANCATIDNVQVDTGSQGLRLLASALPSGFALPAVPAGARAEIAGECAVFGTGYTWGAVRSADVKLAGETAAALPIQLIADPAVPASAPAACAGSGLAMNSAATLRSNGILGVGPFSADCGVSCVRAAVTPWYYACSASGCTASAQPLAQQVGNPVAAFATDNNGVIIDLPPLADSGASGVSGSMIFGIGTQANNTLGSATVLRANTGTGYVKTTTSDGTVYSLSYLDTGSNALYFNSPTMTRCGFWYCPGSPVSLGATIAGIDGVGATVTFAVANSTTLLATGNWAFSNLAGYNGRAFGWGLPFFFGRRVFTAIAEQPTPAGSGPFFAF